MLRLAQAQNAAHRQGQDGRAADKGREHRQIPALSLQLAALCLVSRRRGHPARDGHPRVGAATAAYPRAMVELSEKLRANATAALAHPHLVPLGQRLRDRAGTRLWRAQRKADAGQVRAHRLLHAARHGHGHPALPLHPV